MATQEPDVAGAGDRGLNSFGNSIVIGLTLGVGFIARHQLGQRIGVEPGQRNVEFVVGQRCELDA